MRTELPKKIYNFPILVILLMMLSGVISACFVLTDTSRPEGYSLLWLLPVFFSLDCLLAYPFRKLIFTRVSITMIVGLYWVRMVVTPIAMVLGNYAVVPQTTSWQDYLTKAVILECYESFIVFLLLLALAKYLNHENYNTLLNTQKIHYTIPFYFAFGCICLFFFGMIWDCPDLIRYQFVTILGPPTPDWTISLTQRSLGESGDGPLGILVTLWCNLIPMMQILFPAFILTWVLNRGKNRAKLGTVLAAFLLIGCVFFVATESRGYSAVSALALLFTLMAYSNKKQLRFEVFALLFLACATATALWYKQINSSTIAKMDMFETLSVALTAYFSGPQNVAASIQSMEQLGKPDPLLFFADINQAIPFMASITSRFFDFHALSSNTLFNYTLYECSDRTDQIIPAIGQGFMYFGYLLAPLIPSITICTAVWLENRARRAKTPIFKNICYVGTIFMSFCQVSNHLGTALMFLWFVAGAAIIASFLCIRGKRVLCYEYIL